MIEQIVVGTHDQSELGAECVGRNALDEIDLPISCAADALDICEQIRASLAEDPACFQMMCRELLLQVHPMVTALQTYLSTVTHAGHLTFLAWVSNHVRELLDSSQ